MGSVAEEAKPHAVCVPYPAQGHINAMLKLAKILHLKGFHITFVNTEYNHRRILKSRGATSLQGTPDFQFETIPDGLPPTATDDVDADADATRDTSTLCISIQSNCIAPFRQLVSKLNDPSSSSVPPVTCIISDIITCFTLQIAAELQIPDVLFCSASACGFMGILHYKHLVERGIVPFKNESDLTNGYLDTPVNWIPGMKNMRLRDLPTILRTTNPDDLAFNFIVNEMKEISKAAAIIINTFDHLEGPVLDAMSSILPPIYTIGPLTLLTRQVTEGPLKSIGLNLWKEDPGCLEWLEGRGAVPGSIVFVNFGSFTVMTNQQLIEFAWGLANTNYEFLWVIRPDLVEGESAVLPPELLTKISGRSLLVSWCPQEEVLQHSAIGGFLTHCGWNSTTESICSGVPMICWPFFADQQTNCRYMCTEWGIGMEIDNNVRREEVEGLVRELMGGDKGKEMRRRVSEWKESANRATQPGGSSFLNWDKMVLEVLLPRTNT